MRFLENICLESAAVGYRTEPMHGAGSLQAQRVMIARQGDMQGKKELAKRISGIKRWREDNEIQLFKRAADGKKMLKSSLFLFA